MKGITITSDGTANRTEVCITETGQSIPGIFRASWEIDADSGKSRACLHFQLMAVDIRVDDAVPVFLCEAPASLADGAVVVNSKGRRIGRIVLDKKEA